jgi:hypothetical protein
VNGSIPITQTHLILPASQLGGIAFLGAAVATVDSGLVQAEMDAAEKARRLSHQRLMHIFEGMPQVVGRFRKQSNGEQKELVYSRKVRQISQAIYCQAEEVVCGLSPVGTEDVTISDGHFGRRCHYETLERWRPVD